MSSIPYHIRMILTTPEEEWVEIRYRGGKQRCQRAFSDAVSSVSRSLQAQAEQAAMDSSITVIVGMAAGGNGGEYEKRILRGSREACTAAFEAAKGPVRFEMKGWG